VLITPGLIGDFAFGATLGGGLAAFLALRTDGLGEVSMPSTCLGTGWATRPARATARAWARGRARARVRARVRGLG